MGLLIVSVFVALTAKETSYDLEEISVTAGNITIKITGSYQDVWCKSSKTG